jgi:hypothetical protein
MLISLAKRRIASEQGIAERRQELTPDWEIDEKPVLNQPVRSL